MKTVEAQIPDAVLKQAQELAARESLPLEQIITLAVTQSIGIWSSESYIATRAKQSNREEFLQALKEVPNVEPPEYDRLPAGFRPKT